jgi:hypothetical protein
LTELTDQKVFLEPGALLFGQITQGVLFDLFFTRMAISFEPHTLESPL